MCTTSCSGSCMGGKEVLPSVVIIAQGSVKVVVQGIVQKVALGVAQVTVRVLSNNSLL